MATWFPSPRELTMHCPGCDAEIPGDAMSCPRCGRSLDRAATGALTPSRGASGGPATGGPGALFAGRYLLAGEIGRGGMGVVYRAEDTRLRRPIALKFLAHELSADADARARFFREAQAAAVLDSPHVCTVYEVGEHEGRAFIAMALVDGGTLKARMARGRLPLAEVLTLACEIAGGLAAAHARDVVHRDIKPANILLTAAGEARIADFGIARLGPPGDVTSTGVVLGTLAYMAPEQAAGLPADARSDVWSAGCVFYQMLTGRTPFSTTDGPPDLDAILHGAPPPLAAVRPDAPPGFAAVVERCLAKDPRARFENAAALLQALKAVVTRSAVTPQAEVPSLAVLPFVDMSPAKDQEYFGEGIAEELIHALAGIKGLRVVARTSAFALQGKGLDVREIGRILNVGAVLEGSVRAAGNRIRVTAQLVSVADGYHLWSERFDRQAGDIFAIQDELSMAIVEHLKLSLGVEERDALTRRATEDHEAYNLYLKGLYFLARPSPDTLDAALRCFTEALALDAGFARAHAGIGSVFLMLGNLNFAPATDVLPKAKAAAEKALALDPDLPEGHATTAVIAFWFDWDWAAAEASFARILSLNPGQAFSRGAYAWFLLSRRRFDECLREIGVALALDPLMPLFYAWSVGLHVASGRPDRALRDFSRVKEIDRTFGLPYFHAGTAYLAKGDEEKAVATLEEGARIADHPGWADGLIAMIRLRQGDRDAALRIYDDLVRRERTMNVSPMGLAWCAANLGELDAAFGWVERAIAERDTLIPFIHIYTPMYCPTLMLDPRYTSVLARLGLGEFA
jgi:serine/threonine-protein kinase